MDTSTARAYSSTRGSPSCLFCGYSLRGLGSLGSCPECGKPLVWSFWITSSRGVFWRKTVKWGAIICAIGLLALVFSEHLWLDIATGLLGLEFADFRWWHFWLSNSLVPFGTMAVGALLFTWPVQGSRVASSVRHCRRVARVAFVWGSVALLAHPWVNTWGERFVFNARLHEHQLRAEWLEALLFAYIPGTFVLVGVGSICLLCYLVWIARIVNAKQIARHSKVLAYSSTALILARGSLWIANSIPLPKSGTPLLDPLIDTTATRAVNLTIWIGLSACKLYAAVLLAWTSHILARLHLEARVSDS